MDDSAVFRFEVDLDGNTKFTLFQPEAGTEEFQTLQGTPAAGPDGTYPFGDITVSGSGLVNVSTEGMGNDNGNFNDGEYLIFDLTGLGEPQDAVSFYFKGTQAIVDVYVSNDGSTWTLIGNDIEAIDGVLPTVESPDSFTWVKLEAEDTAANTKVQGISLVEKILAEGQELQFTLNGTDGDGDTASTTVDVEVTVNESDFSTLTTTMSFTRDGGNPHTDSGPVIHEATAGSDTLLATDGDDVFAWTLADHLTDGDTVIGFDASADVINIADILDGSVADISSVVEIGLSGDGASTVIRVSNTGDFAHADQTITLEGVNLLGGVDLDDPAALSAALHNLVDAGKLVTE